MGGLGDLGPFKGRTKPYGITVGGPLPRGEGGVNWGESGAARATIDAGARQKASRPAQMPLRQDES